MNALADGPVLPARSAGGVGEVTVPSAEAATGERNALAGPRATRSGGIARRRKAPLRRRRVGMARGPRATAGEFRDKTHRK